MSLSIDSRFITGIYALGQWFNVAPGTLSTDAYEFIDWEEDFDANESTFNRQGTSFQMGDIYPEPPRNERGGYGPNSRLSFASPTGCTGLQFTDAKTGERVSFSLMEVRAFRHRRPKS